MSRQKTPNRAGSRRQKPTTRPVPGRAGMEPLSYADPSAPRAVLRQGEEVAKATRGNNRSDALELLTKTVELERSIARKRDRQVRAARGAGATWTDLGKVLGISPQAVQQRYRRVEP